MTNRRRFTAEFKARVALEALRGRNTLARLNSRLLRVRAPDCVEGARQTCNGFLLERGGRTRLDLWPVHERELERAGGDRAARSLPARGS